MAREFAFLCRSCGIVFRRRPSRTVATIRPSGLVVVAKTDGLVCPSCQENEPLTQADPRNDCGRRMEAPCQS